jgi:hypothetical protein
VNAAEPLGNAGHEGSYSGMTFHTGSAANQVAAAAHVSGTVEDASHEGAGEEAGARTVTGSATHFHETSAVPEPADAGKYRIPEEMLHHTDDMFSAGNSAAISGTVDTSVSVDKSGKIGAGRGESMADYDYVKAGADRDMVKSIRSELDTHAFAGKKPSVNTAEKPSAEPVSGHTKKSSATDGLSREADGQNGKGG